MAKQMVKERQDITGSNCLKGVGLSGKAIVDEKGIKDSWKEYMEKLFLKTSVYLVIDYIDKDQLSLINLHDTLHHGQHAPNKGRVQCNKLATKLS